jgi:glycosyltransferase involved in cell wall biosynthesis
VKIAVIWSRFGPYHAARLRGAARVGAASGAQIFGIEVARRDAIYDWDVLGRSREFEHLSLFEDQSYHSVSEGDVVGALRACLDRIGPNVVAVNGWSAIEARAAIRWADRGRRAAVIVMSETKADDARRVWWKEVVKRRILGGVAGGLVGGRAHADYLAALGVPRHRIARGYDVVDNEHFARGAAAARDDEARLRRAHGLPERYFLACTRFVRRKNVTSLLRGYAQYRNMAGGEAWGLVVAGGGEEQPAYEALIRSERITGVVWPGFVQYGQLPAYYGLATTFVHPAHSEAWGLVVNEALASGLPVIAARAVGACRELVEDGENGIVLETASPDALAEGMRRMASLREAQLARMRSAAAASVASWSPERFGEALLSLARASTPSEGVRSSGWSGLLAQRQP